MMQKSGPMLNENFKTKRIHCEMYVDNYKQAA